MCSIRGSAGEGATQPSNPLRPSHQHDAQRAIAEQPLGRAVRVGHRHGRDAPVALDQPFRAVALELDIHELAGEGG